MNTNKMLLMLLLVGASMVGPLAIAQQERLSTADQRPIQVAELERLSATPSIEQGILKIAIEKLRQEKALATTVEMALTTRITKISAPACHYELCVMWGTKVMACKLYPCALPN